MSSIHTKKYLEKLAEQFSWKSILEPMGFSSRKIDNSNQDNLPFYGWSFDDGEYNLEIETYGEDYPALVLESGGIGGEPLTKLEAIKKLRCGDDWIQTKNLLAEGISLEENTIDKISRKHWSYRQSSLEMSPEVRYVTDPLFQASVDGRVGNLLEENFASSRFSEMQFALEGEPERAVPLKDLLGKVISQSKWVLESLLPRFGRVFLVARAKTGKTSLAMYLLKVLADGKDFLGSFKVQEGAGRIGYMNFEMTDLQIQEWLRRQNIENLEKISIWNLRGKLNPFRSEMSRSDLASELNRLGIKTLIIDTFAKVFSGEANNNSEVSKFLMQLEEVLEEAGVEQLIMLVHAGNAEKKIRGATALMDHPDGLWFLTSDDERNRYFSAYGRDVEVAESRLNYDPLTAEFTLSGEGKKSSKENSSSEKMLKYIEEHPWANASSIDESVTGTKAFKIRLRKKLVDQGLVTTRKGPSNSTLYHAA